jgi:hypothetical protein
VNVAGIDLSTWAIDVVRIHDTGEIDWHRYKLEGQDAWERTRHVPYAMPGPTDELWDETTAIGIEQPAGHHGVIPLVRVQGAVLARLPRMVLVQPYVPARWRVLAGLRGSALKADVRELSLALAAGEIESAGSTVKSAGKEPVRGSGGTRPTGAPNSPAASATAWPQDAHDAHLVARAMVAELAAQEQAA